MWGRLRATARGTDIGQSRGFSVWKKSIARRLGAWTAGRLVLALRCPPPNALRRWRFLWRGQCAGTRTPDGRARCAERACKGDRRPRTSYAVLAQDAARQPDTTSSAPTARTRARRTPSTSYATELHAHHHGGADGPRPRGAPVARMGAPARHEFT
jgi:hypothetical protein